MLVISNALGKTNRMWDAVVARLDNEFRRRS